MLARYIEFLSTKTEAEQILLTLGLMVASAAAIFSLGIGADKLVKIIRRAK